MANTPRPYAAEVRKKGVDANHDRVPLGNVAKRGHEPHHGNRPGLCAAGLPGALRSWNKKKYARSAGCEPRYASGLSPPDSACGRAPWPTT